jgi:hypothetical protein
MKNNDRFKSNYQVQGIGASLAAVLLVTGCASFPPPTEQLAVSKAAVSSASAAGGNEFAPLPLRDATEKLEAAEQAMAKENYQQAQQLAEEAEVDAKLSAVTASAVKAQKAVLQLQDDNKVLRQEIDRKTQ